jgi:hypothetical protein
MEAMAAVKAFAIDHGRRFSAGGSAGRAQGVDVVAAAVA